MNAGKSDWSFTLGWGDISPALLPPDARELGSPAFRAAVIKVLEGQYQALGG